MVYAKQWFLHGSDDETAFIRVPEIGLRTLIGGSDAHKTSSLSLLHTSWFLGFQLIYSVCS